MIRIEPAAFCPICDALVPRRFVPILRHLWRHPRPEVLGYVRRFGRR